MDDDRLKQLYPLIPLEICILDEGLQVIEVNPRFEQTFGAPMGRPFPDFISECDGQHDIRGHMHQARETGYPGQVGCTLRNQGDVPFQLIYTYDRCARVFLVVIGPPQAERSTGINDPLTGLPNRKLFLDRAEQLMHRAKREKTKVAIMFMDLNRFKPINDTFGHKAGDMVLKAVANRLDSCTREVDTVARFGGDEFVIALADIRQGVHATLSTKRIFNKLEEPIALDDKQLVRITASVGISLYPDDEESIFGLIKKADEAMYRAKRGGDGYCFYDMSTACR
jgi:diguanylate cyclase (GGDEF)-like protein